MRILRIQEVIARVGLSRSQIYLMKKEGRFPSGMKLSERCRGWLESEIDEWIKAKASSI